MLQYLVNIWYWIFPKQWRHAMWEREVLETLKKEVLKEEGRQINMLILGPSGAGKSSFINSILSIHKNELCVKAPTHGKRSGTWTKRFRAFRCGKLGLFDSIGLGQGLGEGLHIDDFKYLLKGHIKEGYEFNRAGPMKQNMSNEYVKEHFKDRPGLDDQMHCVIFVVESTSIGTITGELTEQIENMQKELRDQEVPSIMILTKVDELCEYVQRDIKNVFKSTKVEQAVKSASELFGIDKACIHPVRNYVDGFDKENVMRGVPLLLALKQAISFVNAKDISNVKHE